MKDFAKLAFSAAALALLSTGSAATAKDRMSGEEELAKLLEGRVAGEPVRCIRDHPNQPMRIIDKTAIVYGRGKTIYVQRTRNPEDIDDDDTLVIYKTDASHLCRLDHINTIDRVTGFYTGNLIFEDFIPYTKVDEADEEQDAGEDDSD